MPIDTGVIYCDDNLARLASLPRESVDLIYLDPPFFSNRHYEVIWGDEAEVRSFEDRWEGGIQVYVNWMRERVIEMHRLLKESGSFYLHCDWHAVHYLKVMCDEVFGEDRFLNDIVWCYREGINAKRYWNRKHDNILFYSKGTGYTFNPDEALEPYSDSTLKKYRYRDGKGPYRLMGRGLKDSPISSARDVSPEWERTNPELVYRHYLGEGTLPVDYWLIDIINQASRERLGYPTQKPEILMEKIIRVSSNESDIVLDPFAGCGTTLVAAHRLKRRWIGIDVSPTAVNLMKRRMDKVGATDIQLVNMPTTVAQLRELKPFEFQNWVIQRFNGTYSPRKSGDMGIDGRSFFHHFPIQVKQSEHVGRNVVDNFETAVERDGRDRGYIVALSFTKGAYEEAARAKARAKAHIELVTVDDLLKTGAPDLATGQLVADLPLPKARVPQARPSVEELVRSDRGEET